MDPIQAYGILNEETLVPFVDNYARQYQMYQDTMVPKAASQLYINDPMPNHVGNTKVYGEVDVETFADLKQEGEDSSRAKVGTGYEKTMTFRRFAKEIDITQEMRDDAKYTDIIGLFTSLAGFIGNRMELDLTHRFTFATASSYVDRDGKTVDVTMGDGNPMCYAAHTVPFSTTTYRNRLANDPVFSAGAYEQAQSLATTEIISLFGEKRVMNFNTIVTADDPNTNNEVARVLKSSSDPAQINPGVINPYAGGIRHIVLPYLATTATGANDSTKRRIWFYGAFTGSILGLQAYMSVKEPAHMIPPTTGNGIDVHNDNWTFGTRGRYGICIVSGRGIIGSFPTN